MTAVPELVFGVSDFVALLNQTLEYAYPSAIITGELTNLRVSKNRWVYFDLKDEYASVKFFGVVYQLPGPLEDGMLLKVRGQPRLHPKFGFSVNVQSIQPAGEGTIKKAAALLEAKLKAEGLFEESRKRPLPHPPATVGLVTSSESAAYHDFMKILNARWGGVEVLLADVQVQGETAPEQIIEAIEYFNKLANVPEVLVITRGGGSPEDLAAFSTEQVCRAVAGSRIPTLVAVGHEVDISLAELAADLRASTPSNAAELLVPDKHQAANSLANTRASLAQLLSLPLSFAKASLSARVQALSDSVRSVHIKEVQRLENRRLLLQAFNPDGILRRGYAIVSQNGKSIKSIKSLSSGPLGIRLGDGTAQGEFKRVK